MSPSKLGRRPGRRPPSATLLSLAVDPADGRMRMDVAFHEPRVDADDFATTMARLMRPLLKPGTGNVRVDVYQCAGGLDQPMTLVATASAVADDIVRSVPGISGPAAALSSRAPLTHSAA